MLPSSKPSGFLKLRMFAPAVLELRSGRDTISCGAHIVPGIADTRPAGVAGSRLPPAVRGL